jgi:hypothetical protein
MIERQQIPADDMTALEAMAKDTADLAIRSEAFQPENKGAWMASVIHAGMCAAYDLACTPRDPVTGKRPLAPTHTTLGSKTALPTDADRPVRRSRGEGGLQLVRATGGAVDADWLKRKADEIAAGLDASHEQGGVGLFEPGGLYETKP